MVERVRPLDDIGARPDQLARLEIAKVSLCVLGLHEFEQESVRELSADHGCDLERPLRSVVEAVDTGGDQILDCVGNRDLVGPSDQLIRDRRLVNRAGFVEGAHDFLDVEWVALGLGGDQRAKGVGESVCGEYRLG